MALNVWRGFSRSSFFLLAMSMAMHVSAKDVAGITVPEQVTLQQGLDPLILNGAGIRSKFFVKVYVGALYLPSKQTAVDKILALSGAKRVSMHVLYDEVSKEKLVGGWNDGFANNNSSEELAKLKERLNNFNDLFTTVKRGDQINIDCLPGIGTRVQINEVNKGVIAGDDFQQAVLKVWLGEHPADSSLKQGMLGDE
jgi:hypothetical protein